MNYCTKCQSIYSEPGTCNCYAAQGDSQPWVYPQNSLPRQWCGACGRSHPMGQCPNSTYQPWRPLPGNTCSTVPELAHPLIGGGLHFI